MKLSEVKGADSPPANPSSCFRDISNFKTPKQPSRLFGAAKQTPASGLLSETGGRRRRPSIAKSRVGRRLKALEVEQTQSCRRELIRKEKSMRSLAGSLTAWLNFLFESPAHCGCGDVEVGSGVRVEVGKRESWVRKREEDGVRVDCMGRWPKRQKDGDSSDLSDESEISSCQFSYLQKSLSEICSFDDMKGRMREYLSLATCKEIFNVMTRVAKNIDEGRLKMKPHCPLVTDVGMKERALKVLMGYNPTWLRIGLYIVFGGESLLFNGDSTSGEEIGFLKMVNERQVFSHAGLAKAYAYNKKVEGLYRPGYFEMLGNVILKRLLLMVLILDRAKSQSSLPIKYGIDGLDGGTPLLFIRQSNTKSSQQMITDFLTSEVMHGEGNLLAHLVMLGYKVSYEQLPLIEYDFSVGDLFDDIQDGVRLCRAIQLLQNDCSILMKLAVPSDNSKKRLSNCNIALQYLKKAGVPLHDDDGLLITGDDIANGDKELVLSLLWNVFVNLQIPLLITKTTLHNEIRKIRTIDSELTQLDSSSHLDMLTNWVKAICENYDNKTEKLTSLVDGKAMWCLLDFYFRKELHCSCSSKDIGDSGAEESIVSSMDSSDAVQNFVLSQKLTTLLGNVPQVLQTSDILEYNGPCNNRSVIVLLVFLSTQLLVKRSKDQLNFHKLMGCHCQQAVERRRSGVERLSRSNEAEPIKDEDDPPITPYATKKFRAVKAWWQEMAKQNNGCISKPEATSFLHPSDNKPGSDIHKDKAAVVMQSYARRMSKRQKYLKTRKAVYCLQVHIRAWLIMKHKLNLHDYKATDKAHKGTDELERTVVFMVDRHDFVKLKRSVLLIQSATRLMLLRNGRIRKSLVCENCNSEDDIQEEDSILACNGKREDEDNEVAMDIQEEDSTLAYTIKREDNEAAMDTQLAQEEYAVCHSQKIQDSAATMIQRHCRGWITRRGFENEKLAVINIQRILRTLSLWRDLNNEKVARRSAIAIQSCLRGWLARKETSRKRRCIVVIQSHARNWSARRVFLSQKLAAIVIQSAFRAWISSEAFSAYKQAAIEIQRFARGRIARKSLLGAASGSFANSQNHSFHGTELKMVVAAIIKIQRWWKGAMMLNSRTKAATVIQTHFRSSIAKRRSKTEAATVIQSHVRGLIARRRAEMAAAKMEAATIIQSHFRGSIAERRSKTEAATVIQSHVRGLIARRRAKMAAAKMEAATIIQSHVRGSIARRRSKTEAATVIQSHVRGLIARRRAKMAAVKMEAATIIQSHVRGSIAKRRSKMEAATVIQSHVHGWIARRRAKMAAARMEAATIIQSHFRGWVYRRRTAREKHLIVLIQSSWKGYIARRNAKGQQLLDLRRRLQKSAANVDDGMRLINRHIAALNELLSMKSLSNIRRSCATLDKATGLSSNCCEILVKAGAIDILLRQIKSVSRSIPDQEILKHTLSILRNLARYPHLADALIGHRGSVQTILWEMLRNKEEGYFIGCDLMKKICMRRKGVEAIHGLPSLVKRLGALVDELTRKVNYEKRMKHERGSMKDGTERRLREALEIFNMITRGVSG